MSIWNRLLARPIEARLIPGSTCRTAPPARTGAQVRQLRSMGGSGERTPSSALTSSSNNNGKRNIYGYSDRKGAMATNAIDPSDQGTSSAAETDVGGPGGRALASPEELLQEMQTCDVLLVAFTAAWCRPCREIRPALASMLEQFRISHGNGGAAPTSGTSAAGPTVRFVELDIANSQTLAALHDVRCVPTFCCYISGHGLFATVEGAHVPRVEQMLQSALDELSAPQLPPSPPEDCDGPDAAPSSSATTSRVPE